MSSLSINTSPFSEEELLEWYKPGDSRKLAFILTKFLVEVHKKNNITFDQMPNNMFVLMDGFNYDKIKTQDVKFTNEGIVSISGIKIDGKGNLVLCN